jgi:hypothetical protein
MHPFSDVVSSEKVWKLVYAIIILNSTISFPLTQIVSGTNAFPPLPVANYWSAPAYGFIFMRIHRNFNSGRRVPFFTPCVSIISSSSHPNMNFFSYELLLILMHGGQSFKKCRRALLPGVLRRLLLSSLTVTLS